MRDLDEDRVRQFMKDKIPSLIQAIDQGNDREWLIAYHAEVDKLSENWTDAERRQFDHLTMVEIRRVRDGRVEARPPALLVAVVWLIFLGVIFFLLTG